MPSLFVHGLYGITIVIIPKCWYISLLLLFYYYFFDVCGGLVCLITIVNVVGFVFSSVVCEVFLYFSLHKWYAPHFFFAFMLMTALNNLLKQNPPALQTSDARLVHGYSGCIGLQDWLLKPAAKLRKFYLYICNYQISDYI